MIFSARQSWSGISARVAQSDELLVLKNARVFDPGAGMDVQADVIVSNGRISEISPGASDRLGDAAAKRWDASNRWLLPGFTDLSAQLGEPGFEYKEDLESGLAAAARGGFTRVCCSPDTEPPLDSPAIIDWLKSKASRSSAVELLPIAAATVGMKGTSLTEVSALAEAGAGAIGTGYRSIKTAEALRRVLEYSKDTSLPLFHHSEDHSLSERSEMNEGKVSTRLGLRGAPALAEVVGLSRDLLVAEATDARLHVTRVSSALSTELLKAAQDRQVCVSAAVPVTHLLLTEDALSSYDTNLRLVPPLRTEEDRQALCRAVECGSIAAVVSDHSPQVTSQKDCDFSSAAPGAVGLTTCFSLLLKLVNRGELTLERAVASLTTGPAQVLNQPAASLRVGEPANFVLVNPAARWKVTKATLGGKCHNSPFIGETLEGRIELTVSAGRVAFELPNA